MKELYAQAAELAGREVEVVPTRGGQKVVLFLVMGISPPPTGCDEKEALEKFISWAKERPIADLPEVDLHDDMRPLPKDSEGEF